MKEKKDNMKEDIERDIDVLSNFFYNNKIVKKGITLGDAFFRKINIDTLILNFKLQLNRLF